MMHGQTQIKTNYVNRSCTELNFVTTPAAQASSAIWNALFRQRNTVMAAFLPTYKKIKNKTKRTGFSEYYIFSQYKIRPSNPVDKIIYHIFNY